MKIRVHLKEEQQDLTHVDVEIKGKHTIGQIIAVPEYCSDVIREIYVGMGFDLRDNQPGMKLNFADPNRGFQVYGGVFTIERIEELEKSTNQ